VDYQTSDQKAGDGDTTNGLPYAFELVAMLKYLLDIFPEKFPFFLSRKE
jgi:hypothetical protein